jgi:hypothetical protein
VRSLGEFSLLWGIIGFPYLTNKNQTRFDGAVRLKLIELIVEKQ